jgi:CBS domain-containing protein
VSPTTSISKIVGILKDQNAYEVLLQINDKIGMITTRSILNAKNLTIAKADSLAFFIPKLSPNTTIEEAARLMVEYKIRVLPIVEKNSIIGEIQALSILKLLREQGFPKMNAKDIMTRNPLTISPDDFASKARHLMIRKKIDHLPVTIENELQGILTSNHIVYNMFQVTETFDRRELLSEQQRKLRFPVKYLMDTTPLTCTNTNNISLILDEMIKHKTTYTLVTLWKEIHGIITYREYMKIITKQISTLEIPIYIIGLPIDPFEAEIVKTKFHKIIALLRKSFPFIEEAKAVIKTFSEGSKKTRRYEVKVSIVTPKKTFSYSEKGWELPKIFDNVSIKLKKLLYIQRRKDHPRNYA